MALAWPGEAAAFAAFEDAFDRAAAGRTITHTFQIAGYRVALEFANNAMAEKMVGPFAHLRAEGPAEITVKCWDSESSGVPLPDAVNAGRIHNHSLPGMQREAPRRWALTIPDPGLSAYDRSRSVGIYWFYSACHLTYGDLAGGLRAPIAWSMADRGLGFLHTAGIGLDGKAALIVGASGSGKSSTALTCLLQGMDYLGDDHCLVGLGETPTAHAVYAAAKLHTSQLARFPELDDLIVNPVREPIEKGVALLHPRFADQLPSNLPIVALLVPSISENAETQIVPMSRGQALLALAPSTLLQMVAVDSSGLGPMGELVRRVPCYRAVVGSSRESIAHEIGDLLARSPSL